MFGDIPLPVLSGSCDGPEVLGQQGFQLPLLPGGAAALSAAGGQVPHQDGAAHCHETAGQHQCPAIDYFSLEAKFVNKEMYYLCLINPRRACAARVTVLSLSVCESVTSLTAMPLMHRYKGRYESKANALLKVFDSWISQKILCSKVTALFAHPNEL